MSPAGFGYVAVALLVFGRTSHAEMLPAVDLPLAPVRVVLHDGATRRVVVHGRWDARTAPPLAPERQGALLRVLGAPGEADSGPIALGAGHWRRAGSTLRYVDPRGRAGGIRRVTLRRGPQGGVLDVRGGSPQWRYSLARPLTRLVVVLQLDGARLCAELGGPDLVQRAGGRVRGTSTVPPASCPCALTFASTWSAIQAVLFAGHACTQPICHGAAPGSGSLDLRTTAAYANLIRVSSTYDATLTRVVPGSPEMSLLWLKLAARTLRRDGVPLSPMPIGDLPLSPDELDAVARWIEAGAPESGVVTGTAVLLGACLTP